MLNSFYHFIIDIYISWEPVYSTDTIYTSLWNISVSVIIPKTQKCGQNKFSLYVCLLTNLRVGDEAAI